MKLYTTLEKQLKKENNFVTDDGEPKLHWKKGYSAMSTAACWEDSHPKLPVVG